MQIAYIILAHKNPAQVYRLVKNLQTNTTYFIIHFDQKVENKTFLELKQMLSTIPNTYFTKRIKCYWGHMSIVEATLEGLKELFRRKINFDRAILLSGQDFPIRSNEEIEDLLMQSKDHLFINHFQIPDFDNWGKNGGMHRIQFWHFRMFNKIYAFPKQQKFDNIVLQSLWNTTIKLFPGTRKFPKGYTPYGGSQWWCLTRDACNYVVKQKDHLYNFYKYTLIPDEMYFHTLLLNSPFKEKIVNDTLTFFKWSTKDNPEILSKDDFDELKLSSKLFARKFDTDICSDILDLIESMIHPQNNHYLR